MKILITGNMGYVGCSLYELIKKNIPDAYIIGFDSGFFSNDLVNINFVPEVHIDEQIFGDIREFPEVIIENVDVVIHLGAISNDPIGNKYKEITNSINSEASKRLVDISKKNKVKKFIFASSCSIYGDNAGLPKVEEDELNPLTPYAVSKIDMEKKLKKSSDHSFDAICLRFATACGMSSRLRLDLVLNDFVLNALKYKKIKILSDGSPWRPLINVKDMARAILWSITFKPIKNFVSLNIGSNDFNYQVLDLAEEVSKQLGKVDISINKEALIDKRSYKVNFSKFNEVAEDFKPIYNLESTVKELINGIDNLLKENSSFDENNYKRLNKLENLISNKKLNNKLEWVR